MNIIKNISAEFIKLKYAPIVWLFSLVVLSVTVIVFMAGYLDNNTVVVLGKNPWVKHLGATLSIFSVLVSTPFVVMLISTYVFTENQARGWNYMYSTPQRRSTIFYSKLLSIILVVISLITLLLISNILGAYLLDFLMPEIEYRHYEMNLMRHLPDYGHVFISMLGVIGIQYFLSLRFKGFLIPMSFGIIAFVVGIVIGSLNKTYALFFPYCYPNIVKDHNMFRIDKIGIVQGEWFNTVEIYSMAVFIFFVAFANVLEVRKQVS